MNEEKYKNLIIKRGIKAAKRKQKKFGDKFTKNDIANLKIQSQRNLIRIILVIYGILSLILTSIFFTYFPNWLAVFLLLSGFFAFLKGVIGKREPVSSFSFSWQPDGHEIELAEIIFEIISGVFDS